MAVKPWKRVDPTIVTKVGWRHIIVKTFEVPGKAKKLTIATYRSEGERSAGVIALTKDKQIIIARQFRHGPEKIMDEIPSGGVNEGEEVETAAKRELLEETGFVPGDMVYLGSSSRDAYTNAQWFYYLATDCVPHPDGQQTDEDELVEVKLMPIGEFLAMAKADGMTDAAAVLMAYDKLKELEANE